jgi:sugar lactone lactonase YvrE
MRALLPCLSLALFVSTLTGCGVPLTDTAAPIAAHIEIQGTVFGGQQPVVGAHVYLLAANTTGYGNASVSLLNKSTLSSDSIGKYVLTGADGSFSLSGDYTVCGAGTTTQVYIYALGGNPGGGSNSASGMMAALGTCANITSATHVALNEVSTVAAAYAMAGYAVDATHVSSSGTTLAQTGVTNAFANSGNLVGLASGTALTTTPAGNGTVPYQTIYTLSNILAACINSADTVVNTVVTHSAACNTLLTTATADGTSSGTQPTDTATAMINIAHHPTANVTTLYGLPTGTPPYTGLSGQPSDFTLTITFTGGGLSFSNHLAVDGSGNVWVSDGNNLIAKFNSLGAPVSSSGYTDSSLNSPVGLAIDTSGGCWTLNQGNSVSSVTGFNSSGTKTANPTLTHFGNLLAFDSSGNLWVPNSSSSSNGVVTEISSSGTVENTYSTGDENGENGPGIAIDPSGNLWIPNQNGSSVQKFSNGSVAASYGFNFGSAIPLAVALDSSSNIWVVSSTATVSAVSSGGILLTNAPYSTGAASGSSGTTLLFDGGGKLFTLTSALNFQTFTTTYSLAEFTPSSSSITKVATFVPAGSRLTDIAADGSGNLWVAAGTQLDEIIGLTSPVVTPVVANLKSPYTHPASQP